MSRMECENAGLLIEFAAGRLSAEAAARLGRHMEVCPECRGFAARQRAVWGALEAWEAAPVSRDFDRRLYRRIERDVPWWERALRPLRPALGRRAWPIAAAAGLVLTAGIVMDRSPVATPPPQAPSLQVETLRPDQMESAVEDMEMLQEINGLVRPESAPAPM